MVRLVLNDDQQRLLESAAGEVPVYGHDGACVGVLRKVDVTDLRIQEALRRLESGESCRTTAEVLERIQQLGQ